MKGRDAHESSHVDYPVFKGLQRPLEFLGFQGRYIYWAAGTVRGAILLFLIFHIALGFLAGLVVATVVLGIGSILLFVKQRKGLHTKKEHKGLFIAYNISNL